MSSRRKTRQIHVGSVAVGGDSPVTVQTMTKTDTCDVAATVSQIREVATLGCDIVRIAVPDEMAALKLADEPGTTWVASPSFSVEESYSQSHDRELQDLNAGDAIKRSIEFSAENVAAMMLPICMTSRH